MLPTTAPPQPLSLRVNNATFQVITVAGLELLGPVKVLYDTVPLGVPSFDDETVYHPFEGVRIVVPPGAWVKGRRAAPRPLTITVFELPDGLATPGAPCGPALDLGPHDQRLAKPILVSFPCSSGAADGLVRRVYSLDATSRAWALDGSPANTSDDSQAVWAEAQVLGTH
jgi:hypothetical protein